MSRRLACLFDMDGVLMHSGDIHLRAFAETLAAEDVPMPVYDEIAGMRTDRAMEQVFARAGRPLAPERRDELVRAKRKRALEMIEAEKPVARGCAEVLASLSEEGRSLALASSASAGSVQAFLRVSGTEAFFGAVVCGEDVERAKPDPAIFRAAAAGLGVDPEACVVIEDARSGVEAGRRAGARVVGMTGTLSAEELLASGADAVVDSLPELLHGPLDRA